ncbi:hypothetical protein ACJX0J_027022, partial [Zea mays]
MELVVLLYLWHATGLHFKTGIIGLCSINNLMNPFLFCSKIEIKRLGSYFGNWDNIGSRFLTELQSQHFFTSANVYDQGRTYKRKHNHEEIDVEIGCGDANEKQGKQRTRVGILMMLLVGSLIALLIVLNLCHLFPKLIVYFGFATTHQSLQNINSRKQVLYIPACLYSSVSALSNSTR